MDPKQRQLVNKYLDLFYRRKVFIIAIMLLSLPAGLLLYVSTPKVYQASSLLSYQQQQIGSAKISRNSSSRIRDMVSTLTQIITSRTNLEKIITRLDLYPEAGKKLPMENVVDLMRAKITIKPANSGDIFRITFVYGDPGKVVKVTNALAANFIEENLKYREERAFETSSYTRDELQVAKKIMDQKDRAMRDYKIRYYNEMPEQRITNVSRLISLQEQDQDKQESIQNLERTLVLIADQINNRRKVIEGELDFPAVPAAGQKDDGFSKRISVQQQLEIKKRLLKHMLTRYTENHPEVKRTRKLIARLEKLASQEHAAPEDTKTEQGRTGGLKDRVEVDKTILQLEAQRKNVLLNIATIKLEREQLKKKIAQYEKWITNTPVREAEWSALTREYGQLKRHYEELIAQDLNAKSVLNLERRQKGSQFRIEDPGRYPERPVKPDFLKIMAMSILLGFGMAFGQPLIADFFDTTFRDAEALESALGVSLITTIPHVETDSEKRRRKLRCILGLSMLVLALLAIAALFITVWSKGYIVM